MDGIYNTSTDFDFNKITFKSPNQGLGGNHFIKFRINENPLYIQPPKCLTKQSVSKSKKKLFCDLMFTNENSDFINWIERLETHCINKLYENRAKWFETELEKHDIESTFTSPLKVFKSGKYYLIRANIPTLLEKCSLKIYDEDETELDLEHIQENTNIMTILEIQGLRCSARSFQIDIEIKQILVMKPANLFEKCIINQRSPPEILGSSSVNMLPIQLDQSVESISKVNTISTHEPRISVEKIENPRDNLGITATKIANTVDPPQNKNEMSIQDNIIPLISNSSNEILEMDFNLEDFSKNETITLKKRNHVYYEMYRDAQKKAKIAKKMAICSYLEAKRIKNTYMLDDIEDSDSDNDGDMNIDITPNI